VREIKDDLGPEEPTSSVDGGESADGCDFSIVTDRTAASRTEFEPSDPPDEDEAEEAAEPDTSATPDGFDAGSILDDGIVEPVAAAVEDPEEDEVDLDALFDQIRVRS
jgi:hypothetical protein